MAESNSSSARYQLAQTGNCADAKQKMVRWTLLPFEGRVMDMSLPNVKKTANQDEILTNVSTGRIREDNCNAHTAIFKFAYVIRIDYST